MLQQKLKNAGIQDRTAHQWFSQSQSEIEIKLKKVIEDRNRSGTPLTGYKLDDGERKPWLVTSQMISGKCRQRKRKCRPVSRKRQRRKPKRKSRHHHSSNRARQVYSLYRRGREEVYIQYLLFRSSCCFLFHHHDKLLLIHPIPHWATMPSGNISCTFCLQYVHTHCALIYHVYVHTHMGMH